MDDLLGSSFTPVAGIRHSKSCHALNQGGNQHGLVTGQDGLADRDLAAGLVMGLHSPSTVRAVGLVREGLLDFAILIAVETTVLYTVNVCASHLGAIQLTIDNGEGYEVASGSHCIDTWPGGQA